MEGGKVAFVVQVPQEPQVVPQGRRHSLSYCLLGESVSEQKSDLG